VSATGQRVDAWDAMSGKKVGKCVLWNSEKILEGYKRLGVGRRARDCRSLFEETGRASAEVEGKEWKCGLGIQGP